MKRYLVISYDADENQVCMDRVQAEDEYSAEDKIEAIRTYAKAVVAIESTDLVVAALSLVSMADEQFESELGELRREHDTTAEQIF